MMHMIIWCALVCKQLNRNRAAAKLAPSISASASH